jgi:predicted permease
MSTLWQDAFYALRRLWRAPAFALVAIATLALGVGANSTIFSVINAVLLRPLPFPESENLVRVSQIWEGRPGPYSPQNLLDVIDEAQSYEGLTAYDPADFTLNRRAAPFHVQGVQVSANFFDVLRVKPALGRFFASGENEPGANHVLVLGWDAWERRFGGDASVLGQTVQLNRDAYTIVGVAPQGFGYPETAEAWTPLLYDAQFRKDSRGAWYLRVVGRLKPGVSVAEARTEVGGIAARLARLYPDQDQGVGATVVGLHEATVGDVRRPLLVLLGAVGLVLLIACVNVANLLLARIAARDAELAVRTALGAGRFRLLRQLLTESVVLGVLGGVAGLAVAWGSLNGLLSLQPQGMPRLSEIQIDGRVVLFAGALALGTGLLFGAFPAFYTARRSTSQALWESGRGLLSDRGGRLRGGLVVSQMALAMILLAGAGLLIRSFARLSHVDPGFRTEGALSFHVDLPETAYKEEAQQVAFYDELGGRLAALPGVQSVGGVGGLPLGGSRFELAFQVAGRPPVPPAQQPSMEVRVVIPGYFKAMGIPVVRGRALEPSDAAKAPPVVVLSQAAVRRYFPNEDPLGQTITIGWRRGPGQPNAGGAVVGVVGDVKEFGLSGDNAPEIYLPNGQVSWPAMDMVVKTSVPPQSLVPAIESAVRSLDGEIAVTRVRTLEEVVARSISEPRFYMILLGAFAFMALFLAAIGIFGVLSYVVMQRSREIGIRVALGAPPSEVLREILGRAVLLAGSGVAIGLVGALVLSQTLTRLLFGVSPTDGLILTSAAVVLGGVALVASYLPARRATQVDPLVALRAE